MARLEKADQWNSSAQCAASDIEQVVGGLQPTGNEEPYLERSLCLPLLGGADKGVPRLAVIEVARSHRDGT